MWYKQNHHWQGVKDFHNGVCISRSNITGNFILSGKAISTSEETMMNNRTMVTEPDKMFNELTTESINVAPVKRCARCIGCVSCKKTHLPDQARQLAQKESLIFSKGSYKASYPYNKLLAQLPENKEATLRMI